METKRDKITEAITFKLKLDRETYEAKMLDITVEVLIKKHGVRPECIDQRAVFGALAHGWDVGFDMLVTDMTEIAMTTTGKKACVRDLTAHCNDVLTALVDANLSVMEEKGVIRDWKAKL